RQPDSDGAPRPAQQTAGGSGGEGGGGALARRGGVGAQRVPSRVMDLAPATLGRRVRTFEAGGFTLTESAYAAGATLPRHCHERAFLSFAVRGSFSEALGTRTLDCGAFDVIARPPREM